VFEGAIMNISKYGDFDTRIHRKLQFHVKLLKKTIFN
jgi:hypothetical protein